VLYLLSNIAVITQQTHYNQAHSDNKYKWCYKGGDTPVHPDTLSVAELLYIIPFFALPCPFVAFNTQEDHHRQCHKRNRY